MLFKISLLHERATLRMYTWNFKKLTTRRVALWKRKKVIRPSSTVILKKRLEEEKYLSIQTLESLNALNHKMSFFFSWDLSGTIFLHHSPFYGTWFFHGNTFSNYVFFFITGKMYFPTSLRYLTPCWITILRALGLAQYGTFHYFRKDSSKSNKTTRIYKFFKFFLPRHPLSPPNLLLSPVVLVVWFWYAVKYLKMSHFSLPSTPILHECTVNNEGKYFSTHKIIRKNLQAIVSHIW